MARYTYDFIDNPSNISVIGLLGFHVHYLLIIKEKLGTYRKKIHLDVDKLKYRNIYYKW